jgi:hypothetical protein
MALSIDETLAALESGDAEEVILDIDEPSMDALSDVYGAVILKHEMDERWDEALHYSESDLALVERFKAVGTLMALSDCEFDDGFIGDFDGQGMRLEIYVGEAGVEMRVRLREILNALAALGVGILEVE